MKIQLTILGLLFLSGCGLIAHFKILDAFEVETISNQPFKEELSFKEVNGAIIIEVEIEGNLRSFIFDTGATTKLDKDFASKLKTKRLGKIKTFDSNRKKQYIEYVKLEKINIGTVSFYDIVASVSNLEALNTAACINVSGIIGANAMNKCIWQIDYQKKKIIVTNQRDSLNLPKEKNSINFSATGKGVPTISLYSNGQYCGEAIFDTGSNGGIDIDEKYKNPASKYLERHTYNFALFSAEAVTQKLSKVPSLALNDELFLKNQVISFEKNLSTAYIGNRFLKDYKVTFDWTYQQIHFDKYKQDTASSNEDFGFALRLVNDKVVVGAIRLKSKAYNLGLRLNDVVVAINKIPFTNNVYENYCTYRKERSSWQKIELVVLKDNIESNLNIEKENLEALF